MPAAVLLAFACATAALEIGARCFWRFGYELSFRHPNHVLYAFYPEIKAVDAVQPHHGDGHLNILMLGGSVFHPAWGEVEPAFAEQLNRAGVRNVRIFNMGTPAHTSRDSLLKYAAMSDARFDLVIFYHGVNDTRTNNVPPDLYRDDYSHYGWYNTVNAVAPYHGHATFALPYTLAYATATAKQAMSPDRYAPTHEPKPEWVQYGGSMRSVASFERNVRSVVAIALERHDRLMLMTFAAHVPANYSREAFEQKTLDYGLHRMPIEMWGKRDFVMAALGAQNDVIRRIAAEHADIVLVDQARLMHGSAETFDDPFHLTIAGSVEFARHMVDAVRLAL